MKRSFIIFVIIAFAFNSLLSMDTNHVELKNGTVYPRSLVNATYLHCIGLQKEEPNVFKELVKKTRNPRYKVTNSTSESLIARVLAEKTENDIKIPTAIKNVLLAALIDSHTKFYQSDDVEEKIFLANPIK